MARLREGELLNASRAILLLLLAVGAAGASPGVEAEDPVFFREPDALTSRRIADALERLKKPGPADHARGRSELEEIGYWAVDPLRITLRDGSSSQRANAVLALGTILDRRAFPDLVRAAETDAHQFVPSFAALMLGKYATPEALKALEALVRDPRKEHRRRASVLGVAKVGRPECYEILEQIARAADTRVLRQAALFCLGFFRDQALVPGPEEWQPCPTLTKALRNPDMAVRRSALLALALLGHRALYGEYMRQAVNPREHEEIRRIGLLALGRFPDQEVTELFLATLRNPTEPETVRQMAAMLLKDRRDPTVLPALIQTNPQDVELKAALTLALSNFEDEEAVRLITLRLTDKNDQVRSAAAIALSRVRTPALRDIAIERLSDMLQGRAGPIDAKVRDNMERARDILLGKDPPGDFVWLGNRRFAEDLPKDVEERVLDFVNLEVERVLEVANLVDQKAAPRLPDRLRTDDDTSGLRDLEDYLEQYPYFEPRDIPEPRIEITPRVEPGGGRGR